MCDGFDDDFDDYEGDSFEDGGFDHETDNAGDLSGIPHDKPCGGGLQWQDWIIIGPLSEDLAKDKKEKERIRRDMFGDDYLKDEGP